MRSLKSALFCCLFLGISSSALPAADPVFSGPQVGERLAPFKVTAVYDEAEGKAVDPITLSAGKPSMLVFVHKLSRPGIALTRSLTDYANRQSRNGAAAAIVWLDDDQSKAEAYLKRARKSLNFSVPVGVSVDGLEGPGAYGLNRNVELTILVAKDSEVTANFALVQPSVTEAAKIAAELAKLVGQPAPQQAEMEKLAHPAAAMKRRMKQDQAERPDPRNESRNELRALMKSLVAPGISKSEMDNATKAIEKWVGENKQRQSSLAKMGSAVLDRGMGSKDAQATVKQWVETFSSKNVSSKRDGTN